MSVCETHKPQVIFLSTFSATILCTTIPSWYHLAVDLGKRSAINTIYNCFCKMVSETLNPDCQSAVETIYGQGLGPTNITLFCSAAGSLSNQKSANTTAIVWDIIIPALMLTGAAAFIGKAIYDIRKQRAEIARESLIRASFEA